MRRLILTSLSLALLFGTLTVSTATPAFAQAPTSPLRMDGYPAPGAPPVVTLLTPGTDPKPPIRLGPTTVRKDHMDVTVKMGLAMEAGGMQMPAVDIPAMKVGMDFAVTEVKPNGEATVTLAMTGMSLMGPSPDPSFEETMKTTNEQLKQVKGTMTVNARGQLITNDFKFPSLAGGGNMDSLKSSLEDSIKNIAPPMPDGPLGVGARWEVKQAVSSGGIVMFQKTVNEITALDQRAITIKTTLEQTSPPQTMNTPGMPPGAEMRIESGTATGSGTSTLRFGELVPASEVSVKLAFKMMMSMNGESVPMSMTMTVATTMAGGPIK